MELISKRCSSKPGLRRFFALIIFLILPVLLESKFDHGTFQVLRLWPYIDLRSSSNIIILKVVYNININWSPREVLWIQLILYNRNLILVIPPSLGKSKIPYYILSQSASCRSRVKPPLLATGCAREISSSQLINWPLWKLARSY